MLQQGLRQFPELEEISEINKVTLRLGDYTLEQKARILFRHLDATNLGYQYLEAIFARREAIIHCEAYSPRPVAYFLENVSSEGKNPWEYAAMMVKYVKAPNKYNEGRKNSKVRENGTRRLGIPYTGSAVFENNAEIFDGERML